jgi:hypothetical protein
VFRIALGPPTLLPGELIRDPKDFRDDKHYARGRLFREDVAMWFFEITPPLPCVKLPIVSIYKGVRIATHYTRSVQKVCSICNVSKLHCNHPVLSRLVRRREISFLGILRRQEDLSCHFFLEWNFADGGLSQCPNLYFVFLNLQKFWSHGIKSPLGTGCDTTADPNNT